MDTFLRIIEVVLPVFLVVIFGYFASKRGLLSKGFLDGGSRSVYTVFMPIYMFTSVYATDGLDVVDPKIVAMIMAAQFILIGVLYFVFRAMNFDREEMAILIQTSLRSNILLFGLALARNYYGETEVSIIAIYIGVIAAFSNGIAIIIYEVLTRKEESLDFKAIGKSVLKNPILDAAVLAIVLKLLNINVYEPILRSMRDIGGMATPLGLMCIGGMLKLGGTASENKVVVASVVSKAVLIPLVMLTIFVMLGVRGPEMFVVMLLFAAPIAVSSHAMSCIYTSKGDLCAKIIMYSTIFNSITIFVALYVLSSLGIM